MIILAFECSSHRRSVAIARNGRITAEAEISAGTGAPLLATIDQVLSASGTLREAVDTITVGLGPGSYTGIRASIALASGWQIATGSRLLGVSSVLACAHRCRELGIHGNIAIVVDAQRNELYLEQFEVSPHQVVSIKPLMIVGRETLPGLESSGVRVVGPGLGALGIPGRELEPGASAIAQLTLDNSPALSEHIEPIYLRETSFVKAPAPVTGL